MSTGSRLSTRAMVSAPPSPSSPQSRSGRERRAERGGAGSPGSNAQVGGRPRAGPGPPRRAGQVSSRTAALRAPGPRQWPPSGGDAAQQQRCSGLPAHRPARNGPGPRPAAAPSARPLCLAPWAHPASCGPAPLIPGDGRETARRGPNATLAVFIHSWIPTGSACTPRLKPALIPLWSPSCPAKSGDPSQGYTLPELHLPSSTGLGCPWTFTLLPAGTLSLPTPLGDSPRRIHPAGGSGARRPGRSLPTLQLFNTRNTIFTVSQEQTFSLQQAKKESKYSSLREATTPKPTGQPSAVTSVSTAHFHLATSMVAQNKGAFIPISQR